MQYRQGTVSFTNGSQSVVGTGTNWSVANAKIGHQIHHADYPLVAYTIADINYGTQTITLSANYAGSSDATASYAVVTEFTTNLHVPELSTGDLNAAAILTRAMRTLDQAYAVLAATSTFHISDTPPEDTSLIWLDTSEL